MIQEFWGDFSMKQVSLRLCALAVNISGFRDKL
jgi:hypothetical protein